MKRYSLLLHSSDTKGYWKNGRYRTIKDCMKAYKQLMDPLNLDKGKIIDGRDKSEIEIS